MPGTGSKLLTIAAVGLLFANCSFFRTDYKKFILGSWEGRFQGKVEMYVTFANNNIASVDYTPAGGGKVKVHYEFKDDKRFVMDNYPEGLIVEKINDNLMRLKIGTPSGPQESIAMIYECEFTRVPQRSE